MVRARKRNVLLRGYFHHTDSPPIDPGRGASHGVEGNLTLKDAPIASVLRPSRYRRADRERA